MRKLGSGEDRELSEEPQHWNLNPGLSDSRAYICRPFCLLCPTFYFLSFSPPVTFIEFLLCASWTESLAPSTALVCCEGQMRYGVWWHAGYISVSALGLWDLWQSFSSPFLHMVASYFSWRLAITMWLPVPMKCWWYKLDKPVCNAPYFLHFASDLGAACQVEGLPPAVPE